MEVVSLEFGHRATFLAPGAAGADAGLVEWGVREIAVPSGSALDGPARVSLANVRASERSARAWCARVGARFVECDGGALAFDVPGFSRYRYVDSDDDSDVDDAGGNARSPARRKPAAPDPPPGPPAAAAAPPRRPPGRKGAGAAALLAARRRGITFAEDEDDEDDEDDESAAAGSGAAGAAPGAPSGAGAPSALFAPWPARAAGDRPSAGVRSALFADFAAARDARYDAEPVPSGADVMLDITPARHSARHVRFARAGRARASPPRAPAAGASGAAPGGADDDGDDLLGGGAGAGGSPAPARAPGAFPLRRLPFARLGASVSGGREGNFADLGHALGRSFRVGFRGAGAVVRPGAARGAGGGALGAGGGGAGFAVAVEPVFAPKRGRLERLHFVDLLRVHCTTWKLEDLHPSDPEARRVKMEVGGGGGELVAAARRAVKVPSLVDAFAMPAIVDSVFDDVVAGIGELAEDHAHAVHGHVLFGLLRALYRHNQKAGAQGDENLIARLTDWGRGLAGTAFDEPIPEQPTLRRALLLMTVGDIEGAVKAATEAGHIRLGLIISRALEVPKHDLREDAAAQLTAYCLPEGNGDYGEMQHSEDLDGEEYRSAMLDHCDGSESVSVDERMILLLLAGRIPPVAQYLGLSWYRVFLMELLHGAGSSDLSQPERVCAAVAGIELSGVSTVAPHKQSEDVDAAYHLLKLYADPTASYPVSSGVYSSRSVGLVYSPLDGRFPWLFHQLLSALVPVATTARASWQLAEAFCSQLQACGLPLWGFYVMCSGSPPESMLKQTLIRSWPELCNDSAEWTIGEESTVTEDSDEDAMDEDTERPVPDVGEVSARPMQAEQFLVSVLGVPIEWIHEAKATWYHANGDLLNECVHWMATKTEDGFNQAHAILAKELFPKAVSLYDSDALLTIRGHLESLGGYTNITNWSMQGGLILDYLRHIADIPGTVPANMPVLCNMTRRVAVFAEQADTPLLRHAVTTIADGIMAAERAAVIVTQESRRAALELAANDIESLPASVAATTRTTGELRVELEKGAAVANRYAASFPLYSKFLVGRMQ